jgi:hypothetical protein
MHVLYAVACTAIWILQQASSAAGRAHSPCGAARVVQVAVSSSDAGDACLLKAAAVQLRDSCGNAAKQPNVRVRWRLRHATGAPPAEGSTVPQLAAAQGSLHADSDEAGRCFFGDLSLVAGTGNMVSCHAPAWLVTGSAAPTE